MFQEENKVQTVQENVPIITATDLSHLVSQEGGGSNHQHKNDQQNAGNIIQNLKSQLTTEGAEGQDKLLSTRPLFIMEDKFEFEELLP